MEMYSKYMVKQYSKFLKDQPTSAQNQPNTNDTLCFVSKLPFSIPVLAVDFLANLVLQIGPLTEHLVKRQPSCTLARSFSISSFYGST
jgi:hypothetical protein